VNGRSGSDRRNAPDPIGTRGDVPVPSTERGPLAGLADLGALLGRPRPRRIAIGLIVGAALGALIVRRRGGGGR
jgi:hypothetical protein